MAEAEEVARTNRIVSELLGLNPRAMVLEPRSIYDRALVGHTDKPKDQWLRRSGAVVAVYDRDKCLEAIKLWLRCDHPEAIEWFDSNTSGAWVGEGTPTFV
jgi:hypothetical protein